MLLLKIQDHLNLIITLFCFVVSFFGFVFFFLVNIFPEAAGCENEAFCLSLPKLSYLDSF